MSFESLGLSEPILRAISAADYSIPTPIQQEAIPPAMAGRDILGCAQTGTGKTAAFAIPLVERLNADRKANANRASDQRKNRRRNKTNSRQPRVLVLCPTRELAIQIGDNFKKYSRRTKLRTVVIYGGVGQRPQTNALERGVDIIVATPGRLLDLINQGHVELSYIQSVVLDEADFMLDIGFLPDIKRILARLPKERQTLLFSATMPEDIRILAEEQMSDPFRVTIKPERTAAQIKQSVYHLESKAKSAFLVKFLTTQSPGTALIFSRTKRNADRLSRQLGKAGLRAEAIHSNKSQSRRQKTLKAFRDGTVKILVATDIAARGIDVKDIAYVINYDLPESAETYTHRIGRTGRAGKAGMAVTFCEGEKRRSLRRMEKELGYRINVGPLQIDEGDRKSEIGGSAETSAADGRKKSKGRPGIGPRNGNRKRKRRSNASNSISENLGEKTGSDKGRRKKKVTAKKKKRPGRKERMAAKAEKAPTSPVVEKSSSGSASSKQTPGNRQRKQGKITIRGRKRRRKQREALPQG